MAEKFYPMGLSRSNRHKRRKTGAKKGISCKKRKFHKARQPSNTKIGEDKLQLLRCRGGVIKKRALRLSSGNFTCRTHGFSCKAKIEQVMYHPSSNELMRTNTLTKGAVIKLDSTQFKEKFNSILSSDGELKSKDPLFFSNLDADKLYGVIMSRPGQCGRADGYILEGDELNFYINKFKKKVR